jgi:hypothetical protein
MTDVLVRQKLVLPRPAPGREIPALGASWPLTTAWGTLAVSAIVTAVPVYFHLAGQMFGIAITVVLGLMAVGRAAPAVPVALVFAWVFQNLFVAFVSPHITTLDDFNKIRAYNFLFTAVVWVAIIVGFWISRSDHDRRLCKLIDLTTAVLILIGVYFLIGFTHNPSSAASYLRNIATPFFMFQIIAIISYRHQVSVTRALMVITAIVIGYGYLEFFAHKALFPLINGDDYLRLRMTNEIESGYWLKEMQRTGFVIRSYLDTMVVEFLNTPLLGNLGLSFYRLVGPNFHPISFAYTLAVLSIFLAATGSLWFALLSFPLLLIVGSKGALVFTLLLLLALALSRWLSPRLLLWSYVAMLLVYTVATILLGIWAQDYHVIGFIGGIKGFLAQPWGRGIGVGGNLSLNMTGIDWDRSQELGYTDVAVESAVGVILYQMGVFGLAVLGSIVWIAMRLWTLYVRSRERIFAIAAFALLTITVNGIFQEEALFSPLAFGLIIAFAGLLIGRSYRTPAQSMRPAVGG